MYNNNNKKKLKQVGNFLGVYTLKHSPVDLVSGVFTCPFSSTSNPWALFTSAEICKMDAHYIQGFVQVDIRYVVFHQQDNLWVQKQRLMSGR